MYYLMPAHFTQPEKIYFFNMEPAELKARMVELGWPGFRAEQLRDWVYRKNVGDAEAMTNFSKMDRARITEQFQIAPAEVAQRQLSSDGTLKILLRWKDNSVAETVMIPDGPRRTACVSSQVGCPVRCRFCASGMEGVKGNLSAGQIVEQIFALNRETKKEEERINHVVFMGMGEPLANYANVMKAIRIIHDPGCYNIGARKITLSTVGVPAKMRELAQENLPINLAISLHAPNESLRKQLIPWAEHFSLPEILDAARYYFDETGREITLEYILLRDVNDRPEHAKQLVQLCRKMRANVNLIRYNEVESLEFKRPSSEDVVRFQEILRAGGVNTHVRKSRGRDIDAACGQLRRREELVQMGMTK